MYAFEHMRTIKQQNAHMQASGTMDRMVYKGAWHMQYLMFVFYVLYTHTYMIHIMHIHIYMCV